jgi:hypothetical protein
MRSLSMHVCIQEIPKILCSLHCLIFNFQFSTEIEATKSHGQYARVGFNYQSSNSQERNLFEFPGSGSSVVADIIDNTNVGTLGVYVYRVDMIIGFSTALTFQNFQLERKIILF